MALDLDTSTAFRGTNDLRRVVTAIVDGDEHDEADWIEWKSTLDLATKQGCFQVARAVLGIANRMPEPAAQTCEGLGYVVVGAEPGHVEGISSVDPATLSPIVEAYVGEADGPRYTPTYVTVNGKTVLVVTVEAPEPGDRIFTLRREFPKYDPLGNEVGKYTNGAIFVRKFGRTVQADAADLDALQARLTAAPARNVELDVSLSGDVPLSWFDGASAPEVIGAWVDERRDDLVTAAQARERRGPFQLDPNVGALPGLIGLQRTARLLATQQARYRQILGEEEDKRTLDDYVAEVDDWVERVRTAAADAIVGRFVANGCGVVTAEVRNLSGRFLPDVEVDLHFEWEPAIGFDQESGLKYLPAPPRAYGKPKRAFDWSRSLVAPQIQSPLTYLPPLGDVGRRTWVEDGSVRIRFHLGDLRQHGSDSSDEVFIVLPQRPEEGILHGTWKATVRDLEGVLSGTVDLPVAEEPVDLRALLDPPESEGDD